MLRLRALVAVTATLTTVLLSEARADVSTAPVPIVLVHGICGDALGTFGTLKGLLEADLPGVQVHAFDYSSVLSTLPDGVRASLRKVAGEFGAFVQGLGAPQVDVIAHSLGGLIVRAWMTGQGDDGPLYIDQVRRLITAGTPHFGVSRHVLRDVLSVLSAIGRCSERNIPVLDAQIDQMLFGSGFLADLNAAWAAAAVVPDRILTVVGCLTLTCEDDLIVIAPSATLPSTSPDSHVVHILHVHSGLVAVGDRFDPFYGVALPFLRDGVPGPGISPDGLPSLVVARLVTPRGRPFTRDDEVQFGAMRASPALPGCAALTFTSFQDESPVDATGWWTLLGMDAGCWELFIDSRLLRSARVEITVVPGRPVISDPIVVRRKHRGQ